MKTGKCVPQATENATNVDQDMLIASPWEWWRAQMPITQDWAYLDHASVAPISGPASAAISRFNDEASRLGVTNWPSWAERLERLRS